MENKKTKNNLSVKLIAVICITIFFSCKKKDSTSSTTTTPPPTPMGVISFHLHTNISTNEDSILVSGYGYPIQDSIFTTVPSSQPYVNIKLDTAQLYISNIVLHSSSSSYTVTGKYILKYIGAEGPYIIGSVPTGNYTSVSFNVGLDATANSMSPTSSMTNANQVFPGSSSTTGINFNVFNPPATFTNSVGDYGTIAPMWSGTWSSTTGYYFLNVSGFADTSANQTGQYQHFSYQLGTTPVTVNLPAQTIANAGQTSVPVTTGNTLTNPAEMHLICDYGQLMKGITSFKPPYNTTANTTTAAALRNNIANMFHYEIN